MVYYGSNPTFGGERLRVEAHLLDVDDPQEAKPERIETIWLDAFVRPEVKFESVETLKGQLEEDERIVRGILSTQRETTPQP
jgi:FAD synthase